MSSCLAHGQMESVLGTDAYRVMMNDHIADQKRTLSWADKQRAIARLIQSISIVTFAAGMPVIVWLWKWALGQ